MTLRSSLFAVALGVAGLPASRAAQEPPLRTITLQNLASTDREEWFVVSVPFARGRVAAGALPALGVREARVVWQPFGARWPDGSLRQALCFVRTALPRLGERQMILEPVAGPPAADEPIALGELFGAGRSFEFVALRGDEVFRARPIRTRTLEHNAARRVDVWRCRLGASGFVGELVTERYAEQEHVYVSVAVFHSDPNRKAMDCRVDELRIEARGLALAIRNGVAFGVEHRLQQAGSDVVLAKKTTFGDGQGVRRVGVLAPPLSGRKEDRKRDETLIAAATCAPYGATDWRGTAAFGPFGFVPDPPPWLSTEVVRRAAFAERHRRFLGFVRSGPPDPFRPAVLGLAPFAGRTGDQNDFGVIKLEPVASTGVPSFLHEVEASILQEACRPVHFFEGDATPVDPAKHPEWVVWSGRTHWHCGVSKDRLGKPCPAPGFEAHRWTGKDRQHWSSNHLGAFYLLTGSPAARLELENEARLYLAGQTLDPNKTTSHSGAPRGAGRTLQAACWNWLGTADERLLQRIHERVDRIHWGEWAGREIADDRVRPLQTANPDARVLNGKHRYWTPWQDALAVIGFESVHRVTGNEKARRLAKAIARNCLRYGWKTEGRGAPIVATAVRWFDGGQPLADAATAGSDDVLWSFGTGFSLWSLPAVEIARQDAVADGDEALRIRAEQILSAVRAGRGVPRDRWFDGFGQWDAVR